MCMSGCAAEFTLGSWSLSPGRNKVYEYGYGGPRFGFLMRLGVPYLIRSQKVCMSRRGLVCMIVPSRRVSRSGNLELGVLLYLCLFVVLISLLC